MTVLSTSKEGGHSHADEESLAKPNVDMVGTKEGNRGMFIICFLGIFVSYFVYGILQEKITRGRYGDGEDAEKFTYTLTLVLVQCVINAVFAQFTIQWFRHDRASDTAPQKYYAVMASSYLGAMVASNHSLQFVSYPTQVLGKSAKPIPVMILGVLMASKRYPIQKYAFVLMIVLGVALFLYKDKKSAVDETHTLGSGEVLLLVSLFLDGVTGGVQDKLRSEHRTNAYRMMLYMNLWSIVYLTIAVLLTGEAFLFTDFALRYPWVLFNMVTFSVCSAIGQNFIFLTVTTFGPLTCSIFTTTRKFFTILASVLLFHNTMVPRQWLGTVFVFLGLGLDSLYGKERKATKAQS